MNTNQLKYFVAVAEYRSFTKAANQYYISQTAITQQIHALEESMNVQLFNQPPGSAYPCRKDILPGGKSHSGADGDCSQQSQGCFYRPGRNSSHRLY